MPSDSVQRSVYFYRLKVVDDDDPTPRAPSDDFGRLVVKELGSLSPSQRILPFDGGLRYMVSQPAEVDGFPALRFANVRVTALPEAYDFRQGLARDLDLSEDEGITETTHLVFFPGGVVGAEFTQLGPRVTQLPFYLDATLPDLKPGVVAKALLHPDTQAQLDRMEDITLMEVSIKRSELDNLRRASPDDGAIMSIDEALNVTANNLGGDHVTIVVRNAGRRGGRSQSLVSRGMEVVRALGGSSAFLDTAERFKIRGYAPDDPRQVRLDLLNEKLLTVVTVPRVLASRRIDTGSMLAKIVESYRDLKPQIDLAGEVLFRDSD
ncbi:MAG: hypothetical protein OXI18_04910 [bacterium]|nr:hypothetical protein [bacterium]